MYVLLLHLTDKSSPFHIIAQRITIALVIALTLHLHSVIARCTAREKKPYELTKSHIDAIPWQTCSAIRAAENSYVPDSLPGRQEMPSQNTGMNILARGTARPG